MNNKEAKWKKTLVRESIQDNIWEQPIEEVFKLFCPILEYEWIRGWTCTMRHSNSGYAEQNALFESRYPWPLGMKATWVCTKYQPPAEVSYTAFIPGTLVLILENQFETRKDGKTGHKLKYTGYGLNWIGRKIINKMFDTQSPSRDDLKYYLTHGEMIPKSSRHHT